MRITRTRVVVQAFFLGLFVFLALVTDVGRLKGYRASLLLELDPVTAIGTVFTTHSLYRGLLWSLALLVPTLLLGRFFCGWVCPLGTIHHLTGWLTSRFTAKTKIERNRYRRIFAFKYYLLIGVAVAAVFGSLQTGLLDPTSLLHRSFTVSVWPVLNGPIPWISVRPHVHAGAWLIGFLLVLFVGLNLAVPRFFCRVLCPLGATLGVLSRFSLWRIERDPHSCDDCELCVSHCEGAADPHTNLRKAECYVCMNCLDDCRCGSLSFKFLPLSPREVVSPDLNRRHALVAVASGLLFVPFSRSSGDVGKSASIIRPPGSLAESDFLARCIKCDQCLRICPTNVLQPALLEAGLEGIWTPVFDNRVGYCELNCVLCGQVCPTGAIRRLTLEEKVGVGPYQDRPVKIGTAFFDQGRCLPWAMDVPCVVCEEVCPTSPKAIFTREVEVVNRQGARVTLRRPSLDPAKCIGCGICEHECPVKDVPAVRVSPIGETRAKDRALLLS